MGVKSGLFSKRDTLSFLLLLGLIFIVVAALIPPERHSPPSGIFVLENFEDFKGELLAHNITEPAECLLGERIIVECHARNGWEMERTLGFLDSVPHSTLGMVYGYGRVQVIVLNESELYRALPSHCEVVGKTASPKALSPETREKIQAQVNAYRELYSHLKDPEEKEVIEGRIRTLEGSLTEHFGCGYPVADIGIIYAGERESNLPFMAFLWGGAVVIGITGAVLSWKRKRPPFMALFMTMILLGSIFLWQYHAALGHSREVLAVMDSIEGLNQANLSEPNLCNMVRVQISIDGRDDYENLKELVAGFNMSLEVRRTGKYSANAYGTIELSRLEEFEDDVESYGWYSAYSNNSEFCQALMHSYEAENRVITAHFDELSSESQEVLKDVVDSNERTVGALGDEISEWAWVEFHINGKEPRTPEGFSLLSRGLAVLGLLFCGLVILWYSWGRP